MFSDGDADGDGVEELVEIFFDGRNNGPLATADYGALREDAAIVFEASDLIGNDLEFDGDTLTLLSVQDAVNGTVSLGPDGRVTFTADPDYSGEASFTYTVSDGRGGTDTQIVRLTVEAVADVPNLFVEDSFGDEDSAISLDITSALTDTDGSETLAIEISGVPAGATLSAGSDQGGGIWLLAPGDLSGLTITPPADSDADFTLTVTARSTEAANSDVAETVTTLDVTV
ncbi:MAG: cadherin-like domain-containing protein, partial [Rhodobacteraceae bacterium]|nr:cadherin-like domain-containing protein [Paracoccaceae bacterium]